MFGPAWQPKLECQALEGRLAHDESFMNDRFLSRISKSTLGTFAILSGMDDSCLPEAEDFVAVPGVVRFRTSVGIFLDVKGQRFFIPAICMSSPSQVTESGESTTVLVLRSFAEREGLVGRQPWYGATLRVGGSERSF